jgi:hypothetical protein
MYKGALEALLSYNPFWLRLGMEVLTQRAVVPPAGAAAAGAPSGGRGPGGGGVVLGTSVVCLEVGSRG